jgi:hypothetical protein
MKIITIKLRILIVSILNREFITKDTILAGMPNTAGICELVAFTGGRKPAMIMAEPRLNRTFLVRNASIIAITGGIMLYHLPSLVPAAWGATK